MSTFIRLSALLWPALVPLLGAVFLASSMEGLPLTESQWHFIPTVIFSGVALLALRFNRARLFFAVCAVVAVLYWLPRSTQDSGISLPLLAFLFCLVSMCRETGLKSWQAVAYFTGGLILATLPDWPASVRILADDSLSIWSTGGLSESLPISPISLGLTAFAFCFLLYRAVVTGLPFLSGLLGAALSVVGAVLNSGFTAECFILASALCLLLAAIEMSHDLAFRDALTGLPGRRALEESLRRMSRPYTLAMVDVDHFKRFNDTYGHDAGDEALRMVGAELSRIDLGGKAYRYGGEEFTLLFPGKTVDEVSETIESLRKRLAERPFAIRDENRPKKKPRGRKSSKNRCVPSTTVTVSIGVAECAERSDNSKSVIKLADKRLYNAKKGGRNRVSF